ncbi:hypothetical protein [Ectopseudomonas oleovorans]|uniref:hypothetical protein n=1 Tax=Ectopseudomonas oleovorans TaxID=301 RepID=UPI0010BE45EC|nr:hypothetical protein [Pseudomonas oleovorans]
MNKSCVAACQKSVRMTVESVSGCLWNECPDQRGITVRMRVEWVSESAWNPQVDRVEVTEAMRDQFREDLWEFHPELIEQEIASMRSQALPVSAGINGASQ